MQWNVTVWLHKYDLYNKQFPPNKDGSPEKQGTVVVY